VTEAMKHMNYVEAAHGSPVWFSLWVSLLFSSFLIYFKVSLSIFAYFTGFFCFIVVIRFGMS